MANFALEIFDDESPKCMFYTVMVEDEELSETDLFFKRFFEDSRFKENVMELAAFLSITIGTKRGALNDFFREENDAHALPPPLRTKMEEIEFGRDFPLRLYCLRLSSSCLILFNGGEKTSQSAQDGKTSIAFQQANEFAKKILDALYNKQIKLCSQNRNILDCDNSQPYLELF
ncbi:hypothetical protein [Kaistella yonginensis]|uniref:hypothetical protein n=1 Tax=Kaistella yonginensis TaxID=658267 RepID=UPI0025B4A703|nr:hypothetical protein [Kaistella yonginensis]MDN3606918.1 hypothetical protein [Kaistella yonginensis]